MSCLFSRTLLIQRPLFIHQNKLLVVIQIFSDEIILRRSADEDYFLEEEKKILSVRSVCENVVVPWDHILMEEEL